MLKMNRDRSVEEAHRLITDYLKRKGSASRAEIGDMLEGCIRLPSISAYSLITDVKKSHQREYTIRRGSSGETWSL